MKLEASEAPAKNENPPPKVEARDPVRPPQQPPEAPPRPPVDPPAKKTPITQKQVDDAIERGSKFLLSTQMPDGSWSVVGHILGTTCLPALTLLECGTSAKDSHIAAAADFVRKNWAKNRDTYEIALAIFFLDKLIERRQAERKSADVAADKQIVQALALRLISGQTPNGGWDYHCPILSNPEATNLLTALKQNRPKALPTAVDKSDKGNLSTPVEKSKQGDSPPSSNKGGPPGGMSLLEAEPLPGPPSGSTPVERLMHQALRVVPGQVKQPKNGREPPPNFKADRDDNSNTQFAMMALWAARRHDIPVEVALSKVEQRFRISQLDDGHWSYLFRDKRPKASMTCVGLIGIALGEGSKAELAMRGKKRGEVPKKLQLDGQIRTGLQALSWHLQQDKVENQMWPMGLSLYFMWSVERVAVLYDLRHIEGKDWYQWGATILLDSQRANGSWDTHSYVGANATIDTCFALLFLKRVNLIQDLTDLQLYMGVQDNQGPAPKNR
jgi:hypothetical protein